MKAFRNFFFLFAGFFLLLFSFFSPSVNEQEGQKKLAVQFEQKVHERQKEAWQFLSDVSSNSIYNLYSHFEQIRKQLDNKGFILFVYSGDSIVFWSHSNIPPPPVSNLTLYRSNGWYLGEQLVRGTNTWRILITLKRDYPYHNTYLTDHFAAGFNLPHYTEIRTDESGYPVKDKTGNVLLRLSFPDTAEYSPHYPFILFAGMILLTVGALGTLRADSEGKSISISIGVFVISIFILIRQFKIPFNEFDSEIFNPVIYSNSDLIPSLGILIIETFTAFVFVATLLKATEEYKALHRYILLIFISGFILFIPWIASSLIRDSSVHFELSELLSMNRYSITGLLLLFGVVLFLLQLVRKADTGMPGLSFLFFCLLPVFASAIWFSSIVIYVFMLSMVTLIIFLLRRTSGGERFVKELTFIFLLCIPLTFTLESENETKQAGLLREEAAKLSSARDPVLEFLFSDVTQQLENDASLKKSFLNADLKRDDVLLQLRHKYFKGYWNKFDLSFATYDTICNVVHKESGTDMLPVYEQIINDEGQRVDENLFYHEDPSTGRSFYLGKIDLSLDDRLCGVLYLEFNPLYFPQQPGYPELLLNKKKGENELSYSWARYENKRLLSAGGKFNYPLTYSEDSLIMDTLVEKYGYLHYFTGNPNQLVITSKQEESLIQKASIFSFFFLFIVIVYLVLLLITGETTLLTLNTESYRTRIYASFFILIFFGLSLAALATWYFIRQQDDLKNQELIIDKMNSALAQMKDISESISKLDPVLNPFLDVRIDQVSGNLSSDINLYDLNGSLLASSNPSIFEEQLLGRKMHPKAFNVLQNNSTSVYLQKEEIGKLTYLSGYRPFTTPEGTVLGYLNLPYFAGEKELKQDINSIVQALMNIYLLLFLLALALAGFISSRLSEPLLMLKGKLSAINLGKRNELLEWNRNDEIGELISQYNKMVVQLADSAERLAMSERESAWKEMARQVAHEIKNPLTPMKLSVQHLQKALREKAPDLDQRIERFTRNLVDQIDTLSRISSEFSDFARLPEPVKEPLDLAALVSGVSETFRNEAEYDIQLELPDESLMVLADRDQMIRVFNNLVKNAVQALSGDHRGMIWINAVKGNNEVRLSIQDNGSGIPEEIAQQIFTPRFTTKSGGMGLGLSMVKSIIESHKGSINFTSEPGKGTTFFISLPAVK